MITVADMDAVFPGTITEPAPGTIRIESTADNVAELLQQVLESAATAQETYNANPANANNQLDAFALPAPGVPVRRDDGTYVVTYTYTVAIDAPVNLGASTGSRV
ncbi:hypothetical protein H6F90_08160 [Trichocoleus sp. FACHB-591]|uniref:hypothetical protein n=1 Tax=Trichocoleus sp. FACHB-591 TaxID=2692872 RepID=UPI0016859C44|nr:hypothetical protein [Trichocoleus sp. FACHB-591]MBD2095127.1 hypothetical protein [Trichocoleus sp. FACHB-591]